MRGRASQVGDTRVAKNGYHYTRTERGWFLTSRVLMEEKLGRQLEDNERVRFRDGNRLNLNIENLEVFITGVSPQLMGVDEL